MATKTNNYKLIKPEHGEYFNISDFNANADIIDSTLSRKVDMDQKGRILPPNGLPIEDWIVERGSTADWSWEKWNSGKIEMWLNLSDYNLAITTSATNGFVSVAKNITLPMTLTGISYCTVSATSKSYTLWIGRYDWTNTSLSITAASFISRPESALIIQAHIIGTWK